MSNVLDLHNQATDKAFLAQLAKGRNDLSEYIQLSKEAFKLEREASLMLKDNFESEPTRSVLFRSAATLALNCSEYDEAIKLISYALIGQPHEEIRGELFEVLHNVSKERQSLIEVSSEETAYLEFLREKAINIKVDSKSHYYSRAVPVEAILDTLKNIKASLINYVEVNFKKSFTETDFNDFNTVLETVRKDYMPLCVNLDFKSFSASICVDERIMVKEHSDKVLKWKDNLFEKYKEEVIELDYESQESLAPLIEKYTDEERNLIYNPIIDSVKEKNKYKVSLTDKEFRHVEKTLKPISKPTQTLLAPKIKREEDPKPKVLVQSYSFTTNPNNLQKKDIFESHEMDYAEFTRTINEVSSEREYLVVRNPFDIKIIYRRPDFIIEDSLFEIYTRAQSPAEILKSYNKILIELYKNYTRSNENDLSIEEVLIKQKLLEVFSLHALNRGTSDQ